MEVRNLFHLTALISFAAALVIGLTGCNTMRGFGRDIQALGSGIENSSERAQRSQ